MKLGELVLGTLMPKGMVTKLVPGCARCRWYRGAPWDMCECPEVVDWVNRIDSAVNERVGRERGRRTAACLLHHAPMDGMVRCGKCGIAVDEGRETCPGCGAGMGGSRER